MVVLAFILRERIMEMSVEVIPVKRVEVKFNGISLGEFDNKSSWEGMTKLQNKDGIIIIDDNETMIDKMFSGMFGNEDKKTHLVLKITPSLIPTITEKPTNKEEK